MSKHTYNKIKSNRRNLSSGKNLNRTRVVRSIPTMNAAVPQEKYSFETRWSPVLKKDGHVQVSAYFLDHYHHLQPYGLTHGEAMFVVHLMQFKWGSQAPFPSYGTLAEKMGVTVKTARRLAASLQQKQYLWREFRTGSTNRFHLDKLIEALVAHKTGPATAPPKKAKRVRKRS